MLWQCRKISSYFICSNVEFSINFRYCMFCLWKYFKIYFYLPVREKPLCISIYLPTQENHIHFFFILTLFFSTKVRNKTFLYFTINRYGIRCLDTKSNQRKQREYPTGHVQYHFIIRLTNWTQLWLILQSDSD